MFAVLFLAALPTPSEPVLLARDGRAMASILVHSDATPTERFAAEELAGHLREMTGAPFEVRAADRLPTGACIVVGPGPMAKGAAPGIDLDRFGAEELIRSCREGRILLAGGRPRGTLYAVYRFLSENLGVRWWAPWATEVPKRRTLRVGPFETREKPAFEYREPFWHSAFDGDWAARNLANSHAARLEEKHGGKTVYEGFVHTFFSFVPPSEFERHPEWFSLVDGRRRNDQQLCTTHPEVRSRIVEQLRRRLLANPAATIASVSQNDTLGPCECPRCKEIDDREGSHAGTMLELANFVADALREEFPQVAIDTLAYQYTRRPPKSVRPKENVIVRLCSIECNFAKPLEDPSNQAFADDVRGWSKVSRRLYVWDYVTNFSHYFAPHPNWFHLGANVRFFHRHGVRGLFEQGAYNTSGGEMGELRAWLLARLMWDPYQDDRRLIDEFLRGYYGPAARPIRRYLELVASKAEAAGCFASLNRPDLSFDTMRQAELLFQEAERSVASDPDRLWRVKLAHQPVRYVFLKRWTPFRAECIASKARWPLPLSRRAVAEEFVRFLTSPGPRGWTPVSRLTEWALTPQEFLQQMAEDPADPVVQPGAATALPRELQGVRGALVLQDDAADLWQDGTWVWLEPDPRASNGLALKMPANHREWAAVFRFSKLPERAQKGRWTAYLQVRVDAEPGTDALAFSCGVYDEGLRRGLGGHEGKASPAGYRLVKIAEFESSPRAYVWFAPIPNPGVRAVLVDRVILVPADPAQ
ncbi:MAG: DUF4838 domain-containing protein [Fimbriimonadales bacterium]|nr:DUF4838 domain-containing protein [Fimbriimonadales bacterium]